MYRLIRQTLFKFAQQNNKNAKNVSQYIKMKKNENITQQFQQNQQSGNNVQVFHRLLYIQYIPTIFFAFPLMYYISDPTSIYFLFSCNSIQYYLSGLLSFNAYFTQNNMNKYYMFVFTIGAANCISGPYSIITPALLGLLNFYAPFTDQKYHKFQTAQHQDKVLIYMKVQAIYYFLVSIILILKFYHYLSVKQIEKRLNQFDSQNKIFFNYVQNKEVI